MKPYAGQAWLRLLILIMWLAVGLQGLFPAASAHADNTDVTGLSGDAHPVILVHGWTGEPMQDTRALLEKSMGKGWQFLLFDYRPVNVLWAGDPNVFMPLANYIKLVSDKSRQAGGDGLVYLVAHSMGGLAIRFAANVPGVAQDIGGVVSIGTPHQGSPWGTADGGWGTLAEIVRGRFVLPGAASLARVCLAQHKAGAGLPAGCAPPPYLPAGIALQQIAGNVIVERSYFGLHAYDVTVGGDGIVPASSANGYIGSASKKNPRGSFAPIRLDCRITDSTLASVAVGGVAVPWQLFSDSALLDQLMSEKAGFYAAILLGRIMMVKDSCSHVAMMTNGPILKQVSNSLNYLVARNAPMTMQALKSVEVPSLCDHKPGRLKNGVLKGNGHNGDVSLIPEFSKLGLQIPGRPDGAVAAIRCSQGGIGWPDKLLFYDNMGTLIGQFDTGDVGSSAGRQTIDSVTLNRSTTQVGITAVPLAGDNELWGTSHATASYSWNADKRRMQQTRLSISYPDPTGKRLVEALNKRDRATVSNLAPAAMSTELFPSTYVRKVTFAGCIGQYSNAAFAYLLDSFGERGCVVHYLYADGEYSVYMAVMRRENESWKVADYLSVAG